MTICYYVKLPFYCVTWNGSCLKDITVNAGFVCGKATVLGDNIKGTLCNVLYQLQINAHQVK
jgi:hypothetical protein